MKMNWKTATIVAIAIAFAIVMVSVIIFSSDLRMFSLLNGLAAFTALSIPVYVRYKEYRRLRKIEDEFPRFVEDFTNNISVGMPLPAALSETAGNNYGELTPFVQEMSSKVEWGVPFGKILEYFGEKTQSALIARTVRGIIQAHDSGGRLADVMSSMSNAVRELDKVKKERSASVFSQMITGYFIFFVFVGIMVVMASFLIPLLSSGAEAETGTIGLYQNIFLSLVLVQGIFAGLGIGKMAEGSLTAGLKHSFVMAVVGYTVLAVA
ncbi:MAG: type II secretion system F family protein [Candidatus Aenigmarchaeota archaeon]|nr:type II secretion system F family protein [Candidatus Aenigmarchaeota archaeon]